MRGTFFFKILFLIASSFFAFNTYAGAAVETMSVSKETSTCVSHEDLVEISKTYDQVSTLIGSKKEYCQNDLGFKWHRLISSLVVLMNIQKASLNENKADAFTVKAISETKWWAYFTKRAKSFVMERRCARSYSAFVAPMFEEGAVHLCPRFFKQSLSTQASILMHEVRHFDGHQHVDCTQGNENGFEKACDESLTDKGSYAVSVQTLVGLARSKQTSPEEKEILEAEALYTAFNKFNETPHVKMKKFIILGSESGDVYKWSLKGKGTHIGKLNSPALLLNSFNSLTIFPIDANLRAYRMNKSLSQEKSKAGVFADVYNKTEVSQKEDFQSISYFGAGGLLKNNELLTFCNNRAVAVDNLDEFGKVNRLISISNDKLDSERSALLLTEKGDLISYECATYGGSEVIFEESNLKIKGEAKNLVESFSLDGNQYALLDSGKLVLLHLKNKIFTAKKIRSLRSLENKHWISATPMIQPEVF